MKFLIIGCGSIGKRHINNLIKLKVGEVFVFDINKERLNEIIVIGSKIRVFNNLQNVWNERPDVVFICVPTSLHIKYAIEAVKKGCHIFIEKPLSHNLININKLIKIAKRKKRITMVGCNMRFYWAIKKIHDLLEKDVIGRVISARIETGQYLPDWRPWENY
jgi:predicted dehydrogenase